MSLPQLQRTPRPARLLANLAATLVGGLPRLLDDTTYPNLAGVKLGQPPAAMATGIWMYRPEPREKVLPLTILGAGAYNETLTLDLGLYPELSDGAIKYTLGKTARGVFTLGTATHASMTADPFTGLVTFSSATFRHPDAVAWTWRDSALQFQDSGFTAYQSGTIYLDLTNVALVALAWQAKSGSASRLLVGMGTEGA